MAWKSQRQYKKLKEEETVNRIRDESMKAALAEEKIEIKEEEAPKKEKTTKLDEIHKENLRKREERQKELERINKIREKKQREREEWKKKFNRRTKKGQIPLGPRINYLYQKIQDMKKNS
ncbi:hypothetical protein NEIRO03_1288 [Nematocida sp. AWRm78]|nr:hypothetical protein NEIRO02_0583 [Nematocida sp. AWRm79]KAI5183712.1 hypothetical protein NEIRO03_1288 [Nematocida sp. AWRm78]